jgi:DnaJ-domain-containing protein 1
MINYYSILYISENATELEIKKAYRKLALEWHPDKNKDIKAKEKFIEINEAYTILINEEKRANYNYLLNINRNKDKKSITFNETAKEKEDIFKNWQRQAHKEAEIKSNTTFQEFYNSLEKVAEQASNGCGVVMAFALFIAFGLYPFITILYSLITDFGRIYKYGNFVLLCIFCFITFLITLLFIYFIYRIATKNK